MKPKGRHKPKNDDIGLHACLLACLLACCRCISPHEGLEIHMKHDEPLLPPSCLLDEAARFNAKE
jgi:hypothetical protein